MASKTIVLLLLVAIQLLAAQAYRDHNNYQRQNAARVSPQLNNQPEQIGSRSLPGLDTQRPVDDQLIDTVDMSRSPQATPVAPTRTPPATSYMDRFSSKLFQPIAASALGRNMVYSPVSVHALMCLIYGVSEGKTHLELQRAGEFGDPLSSAADFGDLINHRKGLGEVELTMATKVYYNRELGAVNPSFPPFATGYFRAGIEAVDMNQPKDAAARINNWVSDSTRGKIRELVTPDNLDSRMQALLVNAIYFKGRWENEFATMDTLPHKFEHSDGSSTNVAMMYNDDIYGLAELPELNARVLELAYNKSGSSMLILLPNLPNGLATLERQLNNPNYDLNKIASRVRRQNVKVWIPKFRVEFEQDMTPPLQQLSVRQMFTPQAQISTMLNRPVLVQKILQKAFIDVSEAGTEASAASYAKFVPLSLPPKAEEFKANHPFVFAIRTASSVLFMGHVEHPTPMAEGPSTISPNYNLGF